MSVSTLAPCQCEFAQPSIRTIPLRLWSLPLRGWFIGLLVGLTGVPRVPYPGISRCCWMTCCAGHDNHVFSCWVSSSVVLGIGLCVCPRPLLSTISKRGSYQNEGGDKQAQETTLAHSHRATEWMSDAEVDGGIAIRIASQVVCFR